MNNRNEIKTRLFSLDTSYLLGVSSALRRPATAKDRCHFSVSNKLKSVICFLTFVLYQQALRIYLFYHCSLVPKVLGTHQYKPAISRLHLRSLDEVKVQLNGFLTGNSSALVSAFQLQH